MNGSSKGSPIYRNDPGGENRLMIRGLPPDSPGVENPRQEKACVFKMREPGGVFVLCAERTRRETPLGSGIYSWETEAAKKAQRTQKEPNCLAFLRLLRFFASICEIKSPETIYVARKLEYQDLRCWVFSADPVSVASSSERLPRPPLELREPPDLLGVVAHIEARLERGARSG